MSEILDDRLYSMDMNISVCFNPGNDPECSTSVPVLNGSWLYILPCSWSAGFVDPGKKCVLILKLPNCDCSRRHFLFFFYFIENKT